MDINNIIEQIKPIDRQKVAEAQNRSNLKMAELIICVLQAQKT